MGAPYCLAQGDVVGRPPARSLVVQTPGTAVCAFMQQSVGTLSVDATAPQTRSQRIGRAGDRPASLARSLDYPPHSPTLALSNRATQAMLCDTID